MARLFGFAPLSQSSADAYVVIGIPESIALAAPQQNFVRSLVWLSLAAVLAFAGAWFGGNAFVLRPIRSLSHAAGQLRRGNLSARTGLTHDAGELGQLAHAFDEMAASLQLRDEQLLSERDFGLQVMNTMGQGLVVLDMSGQMIFVNKAFADLLRTTPDALIGRTPYDVTHRSEHATLQRTSALRTGKPASYELQLRRADRSEVDVLVTSVPRERHGDMIGAIAVITDLSERKQAEQALHQQYRAAVQARGESRAVLDATAEAMIVVAPDRWVLSINRRFELFFGVERADVVGRRFEQFLPLVQRVFEDPAALLDRVADTQADDTQHFTEAVTQRYPARRELEMTSSPVHSSDDAFIGRLYVFRDVTHEREVDRIKSELISMVSHELRTPLTSIKGFVDLILDGEAGPITPKQRDSLSIAQSNSERLTSLVTNLLDVSRIQSGKMEVSVEPLDLARLIAAVAMTLRPQLESKNQTLTIDESTATPLVLGDSDRVIQIITNLVSNAHKYTPSGGSIWITSRVDHSMVWVDVHDTGIGLTDDEQSRLFDRFYRAQNNATRKVGGTGLGLSIVRSLVEMQGGLIAVSSIPGSGSTFNFSLPMAHKVTAAA